jgi:hypothetical protein
MMAEDEETQKRGMIAIHIANNNYNSSENRAHLDSTYAWKAAVADRRQPLRKEALHFFMYTAKSSWRTIFDTMKMAVRPFLKVRVKTHVGSYAECMNSLQKCNPRFSIAFIEWTEWHANFE